MSLAVKLALYYEWPLKGKALETCRIFLTLNAEKQLHQLVDSTKNKQRKYCVKMEV